MVYCYILECADGSYYTGWTKDPAKRLLKHNQGQGAKYTRFRRPVQLVYLEECEDQVSAMRRENRIKSLRHAEKKKLIDSYALQEKQ